MKILFLFELLVQSYNNLVDIIVCTKPKHLFDDI